MKQKDEIDPLIKENLEKWTIDRLATVDRNLLRIAVYELKYFRNEIPANVILDEAIEIAKIYGDEQSSRFINGAPFESKRKTIIVNINLGGNVMAATIIDGKEIASKKKVEIAKEVQKLKELGVTPGLAVILVGNNHASRTYVTNKEKTCRDLGMHSVLIELPEEASQEELLSKIEELNGDPAIHGILVQLPLPKHIDETKVIESISPLKDVDGFHPINIGRMMTGQDAFLPCTPLWNYGLIRRNRYICCR